MRVTFRIGAASYTTLYRDTGDKRHRWAYDAAPTTYSVSIHEASCSCFVCKIADDERGEVERLERQNAIRAAHDLEVRREAMNDVHRATVAREVNAFSRHIQGTWQGTSSNVEHAVALALVNALSDLKNVDAYEVVRRMQSMV